MQTLGMMRPIWKSSDISIKTKNWCAYNLRILSPTVCIGNMDVEERGWKKTARVWNEVLSKNTESVLERQGAKWGYTKEDRKTINDNGRHQETEAGAIWAHMSNERRQTATNGDDGHGGWKQEERQTTETMERRRHKLVQLLAGWCNQMCWGPKTVERQDLPHHWTQRPFGDMRTKKKKKKKTPSLL